MNRPCNGAAVKLGGSLITVKDKPYTIRWAALRGAARALAEYFSLGARLVVVHGGGSFGHAEVEAVRAETGSKRLPARAAPRIQRAMITLAREVLEAMLESGLPASLHTTHTLCGCRGCSYSPVLRDLGEGLVPILYGDALPCRGEAMIVSGDQLVVESALEAGLECVIYAIDKPGILDGKERVIRILRAGEEPPILSLRGHDVTGGIRAKLEWAWKAVERGLRVYVTGLEGLLKVLRGEEAGTRIVV